MSLARIAPFDQVEAAQEYLTLLSETVADNRRTIEADVRELTNQNCDHCVQVLKLASYNLEKLEKHLKASRQILNNLRKLRRLLLNESAASVKTAQNDQVSGIEDISPSLTAGGGGDGR